MSSTKLWEVDPETRSKLLAISKTNENNKCVDCAAPSPQWASPKLGIFFCLSCSGIHRSLGVHISFVRSVTMDAFKTVEVKRMEYGGNKPWKEFFDNHESNKLIGRTFEGCTIAERYDSDAAEEWKERLSAKVEGVEFVPGTSKKKTEEAKKVVGEVGSGRNTPLAKNEPATSTIIPQRAVSPSQKARNEAFFAAKGNENAARPDNLPPSQGGKYAGFGSSSAPPPNGSNSSLPSGDDFQKDPMAALTKGFGWLGANLTKQATTLNAAYIQPGMKSFAESDFAAQTRATAVQAGSYVQQGAKGVGNQFNKFVDPEFQQQTTTQRGGAGAEPEKKDFWDSFGQAPQGPPKEKKDFWDDFGQAPQGPPREKRDFWDDFAAAGDARSAASHANAAPKPTSIGTSAMKTSTTGVGGGKKDDDDWSAW